MEPKKANVMSLQLSDENCFPKQIRIKTYADRRIKIVEIGWKINKLQIRHEIDHFKSSLNDRILKQTLGT